MNPRRRNHCHRRTRIRGVSLKAHVAVADVVLCTRRSEAEHAPSAAYKHVLAPTQSKEHANISFTSN